MNTNVVDEELKKKFEKTFDELFPDYVKGHPYDFSHGTISQNTAERYKEVGKLIEDSFADTQTVEISLKVYHFV